jgi:hypothetical protein
MTNEGKKLEPLLKLDMSFGEVLARAIQTKPSEVEESIERSKTKKPTRDDPPRRPVSKHLAKKRP